jgi:imidazolonepropionase-like amidohydrolase
MSGCATPVRRIARSRRAIGLAFLLVLVAAPIAAQNVPQRATLALVGGTLIDGNAGPPVHNSVVLIADDRIVAVGTVGSLEVPAGVRVISTEGMSVLPGLWDAHVHLMITGHADYAHWDTTYPGRFRDEIMPAGAKQLLMAGVTSAREAGGPLEDVIATRDRINRGDLPGPTLYVSGPFLQHAPYPGTEAFRWGISGAEDARAKVRRLADARVDFIKLIDQDRMTMEEVRAVVDEAHRRGLKVVAHGHRPEEIRRGLEAGVDDFEHTGLATAPEYPPDVVAALRERTARMDLGPLFWTPTAEVLYNYPATAANPEKLDDPCWQEGLRDDLVADIRASLRHYDRLPYYQLSAARAPTLRRKVEQLRAAGVVLLVGTDSGVPGSFHCQSTWNELDVWVNHFGIPAAEAIRAATYWPAVFHGVADRVGTVEPGKVADIIAVRGDVLRHIALLADVDIVVKGGRQVK